MIVFALRNLIILLRPNIVLGFRLVNNFITSIAGDNKTSTLFPEGENLTNHHEIKNETPIENTSPSNKDSDFIASSSPINFLSDVKSVVVDHSLQLKTKEFNSSEVSKEFPLSNEGSEDTFLMLAGVHSSWADKVIMTSFL